MNKELYLDEVIALIKDKSAKRKIRKELENHIDDRIEYYLDSGYDEETAERKALERMGNAKEIAEDMQKLHNNKYWNILSVISLSFFIAGLVAADCMLHNFLIINIVDFAEVNAAPCFISVFTFLALVLAMLFARKAENSKLLGVIGIFGIISPLISSGALLPFGYQVVGIFTDFPAAVKLGECFFGYSEVFWKIDEFLPDSSFGIVIYAALVILAVLFSFMGVVTGVVSLISKKVIESETTNPKTERRLKRFSVFLLIIALFAVFGTFAECAYDRSIYSDLEDEYLENEPLYYREITEAMNSISLPMTAEEVLALAEERGVPEQELTNMEEFRMLLLFSNSAGFVQLRDDDDDGIYETKRFFSMGCYNMPEDERKKLQEVSDLEELQNIIDYKYLVDYWEVYEKEKVSITISTENINDMPIYISLEFDYK